MHTYIWDLAPAYQHTIRSRNHPQQASDVENSVQLPTGHGTLSLRASKCRCPLFKVSDVNRQVVYRLGEWACASQQLARRTSTQDQRLLSVTETWQLALCLLNKQFPALDGLARDSEAKTDSRCPSHNYTCACHPWIAHIPKILYDVCGAAT